MKVRRLRWDGFRIPFVAPFETAHGSMVFREGLVLQLTTEDGLVGLGEIAPLPAFDGATLEGAVQELNRWTPVLIGVQVDELIDRLASDTPWGPSIAAVRCGLDVAAHDTLAKARGIPVAALLDGDPSLPVSVNATVGAAEPSRAAEQAGAAVARGFGCIKLKVGMAASVEDEAGRVAAVRAAIGSDARLRLDANGGWETDQAIATLDALARFDLEVIEQPVPADDVAGLAQVRQATRLPIAADEAVTSVAQVRAILDADAADVLVVKPMIVGGILPARQIIDLARRAGRGVIVTTTIDAGIGVAAALHLAAALPRHTFAHGLATASVLAADLLLEPLEIRRRAQGTRLSEFAPSVLANTASNLIPSQAPTVIPSRSGESLASEIPVQRSLAAARNDNAPGTHQNLVNASLNIPRQPGLGVSIDLEQLRRFGNGIHGDAGKGN